MFLFTTTTVINSLKDFTTGLDLITNDGTTLRVKRLNPFAIDCIKDMYKTPSVVADLDTATLDDVVSAVEEGKNYRIKLYIKSVGNADPFYANDFVFKGKPLYIEFVGGASAAKTVNAIVTNAKKYLGIVCDTDVIGFYADSDLTPLAVDAKHEITSSTLVIAAANPYLRFAEVSVEKLVEGGDYAVKGDSFIKDATLSDNVEIHTGTEGFGTYDHLIKDYRLPTGANLKWQRTMQDEMPTAGSSYTQYVMHYCKERGVMGLGAVGMLAKSLTTHVFWVNDAIVEDFDALLDGIDVQTKGEVSDPNPEP